MHRVSLKTVFREKEFWLLVILGNLYFYRPLFLRETFFFRDLGLHFLLRKQLLADFMKVGELPLWDVYLHGGQPYLAEVSNSVLYPTNLLYLFLPTLKAFNLNIVLHFVGCLAFAYLFSRIVGLQPISSFIAALVYGFCGYTLSLGNLLGFLMAMPHIPLLFLFWHLFLFEQRKRWFIMAAIVGVVQVFAGAPETNVISLLSLLGWTLVYPYPHRSMYRRIFLWLFLGIFIIGIASIQILPTVEMILYSPRGQGVDSAIFSQWSLHPKRLPELVFPGFFGYLDSFPWSIHYWGGKLVDRAYPYIPNIYFGCVAIVFAIFGGISKSDNCVLPFKVRIFLFLLFVSSLLLSIGRFLPFFYLLYKYVPLIDLFRFPIKFLIAGIFPLALLTGYTAESHFGGIHPPAPLKGGIVQREWFSSRSVLGILWSTAVILTIFTGTFLFSNGFANRFQELVFTRSGGDVMRNGLRYSFMHTTAIWLLMTLLYQYRKMKRSYWQHWLLACIFMVDLLSAGKRVNFYAPEEFFTDVPAVARIVRSEIGDGRFFRDESSERVSPSLKLWVPQNSRFQIPPDSIIWRYRWYFEVFSYYTGAFYRVPTIFHPNFTRLAPAHIMKLESLINTLPWEQRLPLLSAGGVTLVITSEDLSVRGIQRITEIPNWSNVLFYLYRNETAMAHVEFVTQWKRVNSDTEALEAMLSPDYDPRKYAILQEPDPTFFNVPFKTPKIENTPYSSIKPNLSECSDPLQIKKLVSNTHRTLFSGSNSCDGYLVFSEAFYPGWQVFVDGKATPVLRANYAFSAVFLPMGTHEIERRYCPNSLLLGIFSSVLFCLLLCFVAYKADNS